MAPLTRVVNTSSPRAWHGGTAKRSHSGIDTEFDQRLNTLAENNTVLAEINLLDAIVNMPEKITRGSSKVDH